ncbi:hypothetical protein ACOALA_03970 [Alicyclobacillus acidoterrestris]|uniref:hypothetical protein n=1 Tax=Alicyclobacillus acidoterrestris TaxID=1450 RepID=UPI003F53290A
MPKSKVNIKHHPALQEITDEEWDEYFPKTGTEWTTLDMQYLVDWWGKDDIISLSYALERPPWDLYRVIQKLRKEGHDIPYLRAKRKPAGVELPKLPEPVRGHGRYHVVPQGDFTKATVFEQLTLWEMNEEDTSVTSRCTE